MEHRRRNMDNLLGKTNEDGRHEEIHYRVYTIGSKKKNRHNRTWSTR